MASKKKKADAKKATAGTTTAGGTKKGSAGSRGAWKIMDRSTTVAAALLAREVSSVSWRAVTGKKPPTNARHPEVGTREAVAWAMVGGALTELVKIGVRRYAATYWVKSTGKLPPGMKTLSAPPLVDPATVVPEPQKPAGRRGRRRRR
ncbi:hypothetical protein ASD11_07670 [Aeromicrobium sp. Root495]|uniref:DUF4235 domain-containing protein n=1 Tax=Aeromicrobium sp. Root495 TaxID=1736550 RepID=UPI0006FA245F|nr:DUF4235 domain-containing protein [Aeromicrobium sp. Root495]KQY59435.1 hypothetical protein ASD11_07670 [Aeromicrobium sp. Root495]